jgi:hypothetical protein
MTDSLFIEKFFYVGVLQFGAIVTSYSFDLDLKFILSSFCKLLECILNYAFIMQKEHPSERE